MMSLCFPIIFLGFSQQPLVYCTSSLWDNFKWSNIHIIGVPEGKEKEQEIGNLFEKNNERELL